MSRLFDAGLERKSWNAFLVVYGTKLVSLGTSSDSGGVEGERFNVSNEELSLLQEISKGIDNGLLDGTLKHTAQKAGRETDIESINHCAKGFFTVTSERNGPLLYGRP